MTEAPDFERRFGGVRRLYGDAGLAKFQAAHIAVVGIGGVGSWAAEALARNAVGEITLVDLDNIAESNFNRQLHAVDGNIGKPKIAAMRERILSINPTCVVREIEDFVTPENIASMLAFKIDGIIDCIDDAKAKAALAAFCKAKKIPLIMTGGAGGRLDATRIKTADLANVTNDKLLAKVRNILRKDYAFAKGKDGINAKQIKMHVLCVYSDEPAAMPLRANSDKLSSNAELTSCDLGISLMGLNCAGYGSSVCVTATFGFAAAGLILSQLLV
ncbi:MAG: ThiF family adenylyltransferase [Methylophilaceae bacterium]